MAKRTTTSPPAKSSRTQSAPGGGRRHGSGSRIGAFEALPESEKVRVAAEFDREGTYERAKPLTASDRARLRRAGVGAGRPKVGKGAKPISVTVEKSLLERADRYASRHGMNRAQMIAEGLKLVMSADGQ